MKLVLFRDKREVNEAVEIRLEHVSAGLTASHCCYSDGGHGEHEGEVSVHRVTDAHLLAIYDALTPIVAGIRDGKVSEFDSPLTEDPDLLYQPQ